MKTLGLAALVGLVVASAPASATTYFKYYITVAGTGTSDGTINGVPSNFAFTNTYTIYTSTGHDMASSTSPAYDFTISNSGFDIDARLVTATNTYGHLVLAIDPTLFTSTDVPVLTTSNIVQNESSLTMSNAGYGTYHALSYTITTTTQNTAFLGHTAPYMSFSIADTPTAAAAVPEPASWAMFIGGFGLIGAAMRRKKATVSFA